MTKGTTLKVPLQPVPEHGVGVTVGVVVGVSVAVDVAVFTGVAVAVGVAVIVGMAVFVGVAVAVGVFVAGGGVAVCPTAGRPDAACTRMVYDEWPSTAPKPGSWHRLSLTCTPHAEDGVVPLPTVYGVVPVTVITVSFISRYVATIAIWSGEYPAAHGSPGGAVPMPFLTV